MKDVSRPIFICKGETVFRENGESVAIARRTIYWGEKSDPEDLEFFDVSDKPPKDALPGEVGKRWWRFAPNGSIDLRLKHSWAWERPRGHVKQYPRLSHD